MIAAAGLFALALVLQVPAPDAAARESETLRTDERAILDGEAARLVALAQALSARGDKEGAGEVRRDLPPPPPADGASRFVPLPAVVGARGKGLANVPAGAKPPAPWAAERDAIRSDSAARLFQLAVRAATATPRHYAMADTCLRAVIDRQPGHAEARRLLGYVPYEGGWATPYAVAQIRDGMTLHPTYGWVKSSWVSHLEKNELPSRAGLARGREVWIPADQADAERGQFASGWKIDTEHFHIETNVPLSAAIDFGRHLETLNQVFRSLFADVIGEHLPLAQRFKTKSMVGEKAAERHNVSYFATREQFVDHLRQRQPDIGESLGMYLPAERGRRGQAYFFRDDDGQLDVTATLFHEASHQLLFESGIAGPNVYTKNVGNYWVFEGLGTYFETFTIERDGSVRVGGRDGARLEKARETLGREERLIPLKEFVNYSETAFKGGDVFLHYQQAIALTTFLMQARGGAYREGFLDYVKAACLGRLKGSSGKPLDVRVGKPYAEIEAELIAYLKGEAPGS